MNNEILFKPNSLIMATTKTRDISAIEYKLFDTLFQRCQYYDKSNWKKATITRTEIKEIVLHAEDATVMNIKMTLEKFRNIDLYFKLGTLNVSGSIIAEHTYDESTDTFTCTMSDNVYKILMDYAMYGYTPINLKVVRNSRGYYSQRIYGMLRKWSKYNVPVTYEYSLNEIKSVCGVDSLPSYEVYKDFRKRVLDPAMYEINEKLNMEVSYEAIKVIRKVQRIKFTIIDREPKKYEFDTDKIIEPKSITEIAVGQADDIDSIDYMNLIDFKINESVHELFLKDFCNYKDYIVAVKTASDKTLSTIGGKTISKRNYKYFKTVLEGLIPEEVI